MIEIKDEVLDTSLQPDNNPRYTIKDNNGRVINDNVQIDLKTPVVEEGTPLNKATIERILQYEPLTFVNQEDITNEQPDETFDVKTHLETQETNQITGYGYGMDNVTVKMINTKGELKLTANAGTSNTSPSNTVYVYMNYGSSNYANLDMFNLFFEREDEDEKMYIYLSYAANFQQIWDFGREVSGTFNIKFSYSYLTGGIEMSNDGITWETLTASSTAKYVFKNKRYIRINLTAINSGTNGHAMIYYCFFSNVTSKRKTFKNNFITSKGIPPSGNINFITSDDFTTDRVYYNSIDNIPIDIVLQPNSYYELNNIGNKIIPKTGRIVSGTFTIPEVVNPSKYRIILDTEYKAIFFSNSSIPGFLLNGKTLEIEDGGGSTVGISVTLTGRILDFWANVNKGHELNGRAFDYIAFL